MTFQDLQYSITELQIILQVKVVALHAWCVCTCATINQTCKYLSTFIKAIKTPQSICLLFTNA